MQKRILLNLAGVAVIVAQLYDKKHTIGSYERVSGLLQDSKERHADERNVNTLKYPYTSGARQLQMSTGTIADYFNFSLALIPSQNHDGMLCSLADQNLLINEVDLLLLNFGTNTVNDLSSGLVASVCTQPLIDVSAPLDAGERRAAARTSWLWTGTGACRSCNGDNKDYEPREDTYTPTAPLHPDIPSVRPYPPPTQSPSTPFTQVIRKITLSPGASLSTNTPTTSQSTRAPTALRPTPYPTTRAPTTRAPTTRAPTSRAPTTLAPTTRAPTTRAPTTRAPTTRAPTTLAPTTRAPKTRDPTTRAPKTRDPTTRAPTTLAPTTRAPTTLAPTTLAPTTRAPTTRAPTIVKPTVTTNIATTPRIPLSMYDNLSNSTNRNLQTDRLVVTVQGQLLNLIYYQVIPKYYQCLGDSPDVKVEAKKIGIAEVANVCQDTMLPFLGVSNLEKSKVFAFQTTLCGSCISLDFSSTNAAMPIVGGTYINLQWKGSYGVTVTASTALGGYTPRGQARIYDTSIPVDLNQGNIDLGSPNVNCGGLGVGFDGQPGQPGENCVPINNALIIQEADTPFSKANSKGGNITFAFDTPVLISDIGLIDVDDIDQRLILMYEGGNIEIFTYHGLGDNAVQRVIVNKYHVEKLVVVLTGTAGVTVLNFCPFC